MKLPAQLFAALCLTATTSLAAVLPRQSNTGPIVVLPYSTFQGTSSDGVESFLGMPFAHPPVGNLRLRLPLVPPPSTTGVQQATAYGPSCVQQSNASGDLAASYIDIVEANPVFEPVSGDSEDCLTINVDRPAGVTSNDSLPAVVYIYGGAFETGASSQYPHHTLITRSLQLGTPVLHISFNYRLNAYGFLPGREVKEAGLGNLGLQDQREALRWIQKYGHLFGVDPTKVTIWGESAGSSSCGLQMVSDTAESEPTFRAAFMDSGGVTSLGPIDQPEKQFTFDLMVKSVGCSAANDTLDCLRQSSTQAFRQAMDLSPGSFAYGGLRFVYAPGTDGNFFKEDPQRLLLSGKYAKVPVINGDCDDEGTIFSLSQTNVTTELAFKEYLKGVWLPLANSSEIDAVAAAYPADPALGCPFDTGLLNQLYPGYKRIASFQTDVWFVATRRFLLNIISQRAPTWSYLYKREKLTPIIGSAHTADLLIETGVGPTTNEPALDYSYYDSLINLAVFLDPNGPSDRAAGVSPLIPWPKWTPGGALLTFVDAESGPAGGIQSDPTGVAGGVEETPVRGLVLTKDTFRSENTELLNRLFLKYPF